jgi:hypothetical protein
MVSSLLPGYSVESNIDLLVLVLMLMLTMPDEYLTLTSVLVMAILESKVR